MYGIYQYYPWSHCCVQEVDFYAVGGMLMMFFVVHRIVVVDDHIVHNNKFLGVAGVMALGFFVAMVIDGDDLRSGTSS